MVLSYLLLGSWRSGLAFHTQFRPIIHRSQRMLSSLYIYFRDFAISCHSVFWSFADPVPNTSMIYIDHSMILFAMPHKYILVSQLYARTPFQHCHLHFIIKRRSSEAPINTSRPFTSRSTFSSTGQYMNFEYEKEHVYSLGMYILAIGND